MSIAQDICLITLPIALIIATFAGWIAYKLTQIRDVDNEFVLPIALGGCIFFIFLIAMVSLNKYHDLMKLKG